MRRLGDPDPERAPCSDGLTNMATHNLVEGALTIDTFGSFASLKWTDHLIAVNPHLVNGGVDGVVLWIEFGAGGSSTRVSWSFTTAALAIAAGRDFLRACAHALRAGDPASPAPV